MELGTNPVEIMPSNSFTASDDHIESFGSTDFSTQSKDDLTSDKMELSHEPATPTAPALIPSLKGTMTYSGGIVTCKGRWAMSDQAHEIEGQSSDFEFKLVKADSDSAFFPINGKYQGWFLIKQPPPLKGSVKIDDKDMIMKFISRGDGTFTIQGQGHNRLGKFNLQGTLTNEGLVHIYREYFYLVPLPASQKKAAVTPSTKKEDRKKEIGIPKEQIPEPISTPREGAARVRKQSSLLKEYHDPLQKAPAAKATPRESIKPSSSSVSLNANGSERSHRLGPGMKKCADLLKDLSKLPQAQWFLEPVDPVKYNIPDYPKIIKFPMDFSTIRKNIETGAYDSINGFAEHMRLVFRNAITYNQAKDSLVHIAAREISNKFEDKFRVLVTQLDPASMMEETTPRGSKLSGIKRSKSKDVIAAGRTGKFPPGPRQFTAQYNLPPAAVDGSTMKILEMQQIIANMQDELKQLRTVVKESEISKRLNETKEAAQNPLSFDEKKVLVAQIHKLPAEKMERVLAIIQEAMPQCGEGVVEVPIDSLDTLTLRKLQSFVQANLVEKKKRPYVPKSENSNKRPRKARTPKSALGADNLSNNDEGLGLFDDGNDDLLFETDSFEDMVKDEDDNQNSTEDPDEYARHVLAEYEKLRSNNNMIVDDDGNEMKFPNSSHHLDSPHDGLTSSGNDVEEEDDDNLWSEAAAEIQNKKQAYDDVYEV